MASEQMKATAAAIRTNRVTGEPSIAERRARMETMQAGLPLPADVRTTNLSIAGVQARWVATPEARADRAVLYLHGGGYVMGSLDTHQELMGRLSRHTRARVLGLDYRLAPEHPFPAAVDDAVAAYRWLLAQGIASKRLMIAGDSAGGGLSLATLLQLRDAGSALPAGAILFSPWTDLTGSGASVQTRAAADPMIAPADLAALAHHYFGATDPRHPLVSPVFADLTGLPPLLIQVGDDEILLDDSTRLAANARKAGVEAELSVFEGAFHVFQAIPHLPEANAALADAGAFFARRVPG